MRSPYMSDSYRVRNVDFTGYVGQGIAALSGGFGVRPALLSEKLCVRRPQSSRMVCVLSNSTAMSTTVMQSRVDTACAPLSSQREQNYKRSPYSGDSRQVRYVPLFGLVYGYYAIYGGLGVRPALFSKGQNYSVRRPQATRILCAMSTSTAMSATAAMQSPAASACAPLSSQREQNYKRSPSTELSHHVRYVNFNDYVNGNDTVSGGFGVRPLSFRRNYAFAILRQFDRYAHCQS